MILAKIYNKERCDSITTEESKFALLILTFVLGRKGAGHSSKSKGTMIPVLGRE